MQTSLHHTALHAGMVKFRFEEFWTSVSETTESKIFCAVQVPVLQGTFLTPSLAFEAYFPINTFSLLSLPSLWRKHGTHVDKKMLTMLKICIHKLTKNTVVYITLKLRH